MKQTIFETKERANELLKESLQIWRQSDYADSLEGLANDPVFSLLIGALAYQENEYESEIERLKQEITEDFARLMTPFEVGHAIPASILISTMPSESLSETSLNGDSEFRIAGEFSFLPLFDSKVLNVTVGDVERLDGRRWKMDLNFKHPVSDLSGFCFAVKDIDFRSLNIKIKGADFHLIRPWNYSELPFSKYFNPDSLLYNHGEYFSGSMIPFDIFVRQNLRLFWIDNFNISDNREEFSKITMILEFTGIKDNFVFDENNIVVNTNILVNARIHEATLSSSSPIARISGFTEGNPKETSNQFLQLIRPSENQIYANTEIEVRRVSADRFNQGSLVKLLNTIVNKYHTDFYAFQNLEEMKSDQLIYNLQELVSKMVKISQKDYLKRISGVYLLLHDKKNIKDSSFSITVKYLSTAGASVNSILDKNVELIGPGNLNARATKLESTPLPGYDEVSSETTTKTLLKYYMLTNDRIVTPSDIKLFCIKELQRRYSIGEETIKKIGVSHRLTKDSYGPGYEICVDINISGSNMMQKSLGKKLSLLEFQLQKMMEVRSTGIYPIRVNIIIEELN